MRVRLIASSSEQKQANPFSSNSLTLHMSPFKVHILKQESIRTSYLFGQRRWPNNGIIVVAFEDLTR